MTKKFVIATDPMSPADIRSLKDFLTGHGWWKWLPNFWLVADTKDDLSAGAIRDKIRELDSTVRAWVFEVEPTDWAASTKKNDEGRDGSEWVKQNFMTESE